MLAEGQPSRSNQIGKRSGNPACGVWAGKHQSQSHLLSIRVQEGIISIIGELFWRKIQHCLVAETTPIP
jgi:hypothetical protein